MLKNNSNKNLTTLSNEYLPPDSRVTISGYNLLLQQQVEDILKEFNQNNIPVVLLKGIALLFDVYKDLSERTMGDVDFLVRPEHFDAARDILTARGLSFIHGNMSNAAVYGTFDPFEIFIDLHISLIDPKSPSQQRVYSPDEKNLWERAVPIQYGQAEAFLLSPEDRLIYLCFHILKERFSKDKWLTDLKLFLQEKGHILNREKFIHTAQKSGTYKLCAMIIDYLESMGEQNASLLNDAEAKNDLLIYKLEYAIFKILLGHRLRKIFRVREMLWIISMDSIAKKLGFLKDLCIYVPRKTIRYIFYPKQHRIRT